MSAPSRPVCAREGDSYGTAACFFCQMQLDDSPRRSGSLLSVCERCLMHGHVGPILADAADDAEQLQRALVVTMGKAWRAFARRREREHLREVEQLREELTRLRASDEISFGSAT